MRGASHIRLKYQNEEDLFSQFHIQWYYTVHLTVDWLASPVSDWAVLTLAGLAITAQAEAGATAAGAGLVAVAQETDVRATSSLPKLVWSTGMTTHCAHTHTHTHTHTQGGINWMSHC